MLVLFDHLIEILIFIQIVFHDLLYDQAFDPIYCFLTTLTYLAFDPSDSAHYFMNDSLYNLNLLFQFLLTFLHIRNLLSSFIEYNAFFQVLRVEESVLLIVLFD